MKRHYYTGYYDTIDDKGNKYSLVITDEHFKRHFKTLEEIKEQIKRHQKNCNRKDLTRTYEDGTQVRLSSNDTNDITYHIEEHFDEVNEVFVEEHKHTYNEKERKFEESISL